MNLKIRQSRFNLLDLAAAGLLIGLLIFYLYNLTGWLVFDDEGEYLYQVWRMTLGELPYRDFLTPQLPVFLYSGMGVMKALGNELLIMRAYSVLLAFGTAIALYLAGTRHKSRLVGLLALALFLLHPDVFREMRIFRNEPIFIFLITVGIVIGTWSKVNPQPLQLAAAGLSFGLATMVKLFGVLPVTGIGLWLLWDWWHYKRSFRDFFIEVMAFGLPYIVVLVAFFTLFSVISSEFTDLVLGHHLSQGEELGIAEIIQNKLQLVGLYFRLYPVLIIAAFLSAILGFKDKDHRRQWAWQILTVAAFLVVSRQFGQRHFMYLLPVLILLVSWLLTDALQGRFHMIGTVTAVVAGVFIVMPWMSLNLDRIGWRDNDTVKVLSLIDDTTDTNETILSDDIGLAYYAERPTTYSGAALSHGAVTSGQITGEDLIAELVESDATMVIVDESLLTGNHMVFLRDYPRFHRFLEMNFNQIDKIRRDYQELAIWHREPGNEWQTDDRIDISMDENSVFGDHIYLLGYDLESEFVEAGGIINLKLFWQADQPADNYWSVFVHLIGPNGELIAQDDKVPYEGLYPPNRWWPGQIIDDQHHINVPIDAALGLYTLRLGMYDHLTGERLSAKTGDGVPASNDQIELDSEIVIRKQ